MNSLPGFCRDQGRGAARIRRPGPRRHVNPSGRDVPFRSPQCNPPDQANFLSASSSPSANEDARPSAREPRAVIMNVKARRMSRLVRLAAGRNTLRRRVDRIEGTVLMVLSAAFLAAVAVA